MVSNLNVDEKQKHLYKYLVDRECIAQIETYNEEYLSIFSPDILKKVTAGEDRWEHCVPDVVANKIKQQKLFGYGLSA